MPDICIVLQVSTEWVVWDDFISDVSTNAEVSVCHYAAQVQTLSLSEEGDSPLEANQLTGIAVAGLVTLDHLDVQNLPGALLHDGVAAIFSWMSRAVAPAISCYMDTTFKVSDVAQECLLFFLPSLDDGRDDVAGLVSVEGTPAVGLNLHDVQHPEHLADLTAWGQNGPRQQQVAHR